jgi:hypothetical protein
MALSPLRFLASRRVFIVRVFIFVGPPLAKDQPFDDPNPIVSLRASQPNLPLLHYIISEMLDSYYIVYKLFVP